MDSESIIGDELIAWCSSVVGPCVLFDTHERYHGRTGVARVVAGSTAYYLKVYRDRSTWAVESRALAEWAPAFSSHAPRLVAVREGDPCATLISELAGRSMGEVELSDRQARAVWRDAGSALVALHALSPAERFGPSSGSAETYVDEVDYIASELSRLARNAHQRSLLSGRELTVVHEAREMAPIFAGESAVPCHRDFCPANWLVLEDGTWSGVIDFEFACGDVRASEFARYPDWEWIHRPDRVDALLEGYGLPIPEDQLWVARVLYAVGAVVWGAENAFLGFAAEGRDALRHLRDTA